MGMWQQAASPHGAAPAQHKRSPGCRDHVAGHGFFPPVSCLWDGHSSGWKKTDFRNVGDTTESPWLTMCLVAMDERLLHPETHFQ